MAQLHPTVLIYRRKNTAYGCRIGSEEFQARLAISECVLICAPAGWQSMAEPKDEVEHVRGVKVFACNTRKCMAQASAADRYLRTYCVTISCMSRYNRHISMRNGRMNSQFIKLNKKGRKGITQDLPLDHSRPVRDG